MTTIATITDIHNGPAAVGNGAHLKLNGEALDKTTQFVKHVNNLKAIDCSINLGDSIEHQGTDNDADRSNMQAVLEVLNSLKTPCHTITGNHDLMNLSESAVLNLLGRKSLHYSTSLGDHQLITLNSRTHHRDGSQIFVDSAQIEWLDSELSRLDKPAIIAIHHPLSDQDLSDNRWFADYPQCALVQNRDEVRSTIQKHDNVIAVLNGHTHCNSLDIYDGIPYVTQNSLIERVGEKDLAANTHGLVTLKDAQFGMEIFGNDLKIMTHQQVVADLSNTYSSIAASYQKRTAPYGEDECREFDKIAGQIEASKDLCVVDYGCGPARDAGHFMSKGFQYVGVDASDAFIQHGKESYPDAEFYRGDFAHISLPNSMADIVWHSSSLQHVKKDKLQQVLKKAFDTLKPGGYFYAHYRSGVGESIQISSEYAQPIARFIALYEEKEMNEALSTVGFNIVSSRTFDHQYPGLKGATVKYKSKVVARKPG